MFESCRFLHYATISHRFFGGFFWSLGYQSNKRKRKGPDRNSVMNYYSVQLLSLKNKIRVIVVTMQKCLGTLGEHQFAVRSRYWWGRESASGKQKDSTASLKTEKSLEWGAKRNAKRNRKRNRFSFFFFFWGWETISWLITFMHVIRLSCFTWVMWT